MVGSRKRSGQFPLVRATPPYGTPLSTPPSSSQRARDALEHSGRIKVTSSYPPDFGLITPAQRVVEELLCVEAGERVVIVHDDANAEVAIAFENASAERGAAVERLMWGSLIERPLAACRPDVLAAVGSAAATVLAVSWEEGEYNARHAVVGAAVAARTRHVHMVGTGRKAFLASMMASTGRVFALLDALRSAMRPNTRLTVTSEAGTSLEVDMAPHLRWFANGQVVRPGHWVNVPFGALISSPMSVTGTYVVNASLGGGVGARLGSLAERPIKLSIEGGRVRRVECRDIAIKRYVETFIAEGQGHDRIGLLSLGANIGILSALGEIVHDENMPGVHLALGDPFGRQTGATWTSHGQLAFASVSNNVDLDDRPLIRRGRYVRFV